MPVVPVDGPTMFMRIKVAMSIARQIRVGNSDQGMAGNLLKAANRLANRQLNNGVRNQANNLHSRQPSNALSRLRNNREASLTGAVPVVT